MAETKFTPGPWVVQNTGDVFTPLGAVNREGVEADSNDGWQIAECVVGSTSVEGESLPLSLDEWKANAHLIAAAPELYEALQDARGVIQALINDGYSGYVDTRTRIDKALAKARGENHA